MRKDVKLGLSVGSVLFAVIIVYLVVASHKNSRGGADIADSGDPAMVDPQDSGTKQDVVVPIPPVKPAPPPLTDIKPVPPVTVTPPGDANWRNLLAGQVKIENPSAHKSEDTKLPDAGNVTPPLLKGSGADRGADNGTGGSKAVVTPKVSTDAGTSGPQRTHVIQPGESYSSIARAAYGRASYHTLIQRANPNINPNRLRPGITIVLPEAPTGAAPAALTTTVIRSPREDGAAVPTDPAHEYRVKSGDSLYAISCKLYGRADHVEQIYELNRDVIGSDKGRLKLDMVLRLPESPTMTAQR